jgi:hypothetical protein
MAYKEPWNINLGYPVDCACETYGSSSGTTVGVSTSNWNTAVGNSINYTYNGNGDVETAEYLTNGILQFTLTYTYDGNDNVIAITTT